MLACLGAAAALFAVTLLYLKHGLVDDAFIFFRYAENLAGGHGLVWNLGESPVEGHSSLLWLLLLAGLHWVSGVALPSLAQALGVGLSLCALLMAWRLAARCIEAEEARPFAVLAAIAVAASPLLARHALNGLETSLTVFLYLALAWLWALPQPSGLRGPLLLAFAAFVGLLIRPDSPAYSVPGSAAALALAAPDLRSAARRVLWFGLAFAAPVVAYLIWKLETYGGILPLPALIKFSPPDLYSDGPELRRVLNLWLGFAKLLAPYLMLALAGAVLLRFRLPRAAWPVAAASLGFGLYLLTTVPLMNFDWRLHYPALPPLAAVSVGLWCAGLSRNARETGRARWNLAVLAISVGWLVLDGAALAHDTRTSARWDLRTAPRHEALGRALAEVPGLSISYSEAGRVPFYSRARVLDVAGLNDRFVAQHRRAGDIDGVFERYLVTQVGLPDVMVDSPGYEYSRLPQLPALAGLYAPLCFDGLDLAVRIASPLREAVEAALLKAGGKTGRAACQDL